MGQNTSNNVAGISYKDNTKKQQKLVVAGSRIMTFRSKLRSRCTRIIHAASHHANSAHKHISSASSSASSSSTVTSSSRDASLEQRHAMRDLLTSWSLDEIERLVSLYTDTEMLAELGRDSELARPHTNSLKDDLSTLFDEKLATDVDIVYKNMSFSVHRALLSIRCPYLANILARNPQSRQVHLTNEEVFDINVNVFSLLLKYLYIGDIQINQLSMQADVSRVVGKFHVPNSLQVDVSRMLDEAEQTGDVLITFSGGAAVDGESSPAPSIRCHRMILAARSPFLRSLIERRMNESREEGTTIEIILDESIISRRYAHSLVNAMYTDKVDVTLIHESPSLKNLRDVQAMVSAAATSSSYYTGTSALSVVLTDLYHIGEFLDIPRICQECEDELDATLNLDNIAATLTWCLESYGSKWLRRQCLDFCRRHFLKLSQSRVLYCLSEESFIQIISSDNIQASECDILAAILKWSENMLIRQFDSRDFKFSNNFYKRNIKTEICDHEILKLVANKLLRELRPSFLLPVRSSRTCNYDSYQVAIRLGLVTNGNQSITSADRWLHGDTPRLFGRHINEAKMALRDKYVSSEVSMPDTLYMLDRRNSPLLRQYQAVSSRSIYEQYKTDMFEITNEIPLPFSYPALTRETHSLMRSRQKNLMQCSLCRNALLMGDIQSAIAIEYVNLQVVREFGYNDSLAYQLFSKQWTTSTLKTTRYRRIINTVNSNSNSPSSRPKHMPDIAVETLDLSDVIT